MNSSSHNNFQNNRELFHKKIYTELSQALVFLKKRQGDKKLITKVENLLGGNIPDPLKGIGKNAVIFRQVATPNYECRYYIELARDNNLKSNFFEYHTDKFTSNNFYKHSLGQLIVHKNKNNKNGQNIEEKFTIIDFNKFNGKKLKDVVTFSDMTLVDFHKSLFDIYGYNKDDLYFYDASSWFKANGPKAIDYYTNFILLFICHGILFENFLLKGDEYEFTKNVFLPAFEKASALAGVKPLIIPIPPMDSEIEEDAHWNSYDVKIKPYINKKII